MIIKRIRLNNYKKFAKEINISLDNTMGRIGVLGPNGAGKSSLLDVIPIALFGTDAIIGKKEYLRTQDIWDNNKNVTIELAFIYDNTEYMVIREFKGVNLTSKASLYRLNQRKISEKEKEIEQEVEANITGSKEIAIDTKVNTETASGTSLEVNKDREYTLIASTTRGVNSYIEKLLNMNFQTFSSTIYCRQKELSKLSTMDPAERKSFVLKIAGVHKIEEEIKKCRAYKNELKNASKYFKEELDSKESISNKISSVQKEIQSAKEEIIVLKEKEKELSEKYKEARLNNDLYMAKYETYNNIDSVIKELNAEALMIKSSLENLEKEKENLLKEQQYIDDNEDNIVNNIKIISDKLVRLQEMRIENIKKHEIEKNLINNRLKLLEIEDKKKLLKDKQAKIKYNPKEVNVIDEYIIQKEEYAEVIKEKISTKEAEITQLKISLDENNIELSRLNKMLTEYNDNKNGIAKSECSCPTCKQAISMKQIAILIEYYNKDIQDTTIRYSMMKETIATLRNHLDETNEGIKNLKNSKLEFEEKKNLNGIIIAQIKSLEENSEVLEKEIEEKNLELSDYEHLDFSEEEYKRTEKEKLEAEELVQQLNIAKNSTRRLPSIMENIYAEKSKLKEKEDKIASLNKELKEHNFSKEILKKHQCEYDKVASELENLKLKLIALDTDTRNKETVELNYLKEQLATCEKRQTLYENQNEDLDNFSIIEEGLMETKKSIIQTINPLINSHLSAIFKVLINDKYEDIELDDDYNIVIYDNGQPYPLNRFSGGEQDIANLALRLAISKFLTTSNNGIIEFIILDEIFASLDNHKKTLIIDVLGELNKFFKQIFIITHEDIIKTALDRHFIITETMEGYATISQ